MKTTVQKAMLLSPSQSTPSTPAACSSSLTMPRLGCSSMCQISATLTGDMAMGMVRMAK